jgi:hypothetical protein
VQNPVQKATGKLNQWCWKTNKHGGLLHQGFMPQEKNSRVAQCSRHKVPLEPYLRSADLPPTQTPERADSTRSVQMWASWTVGNNTRRWTKILADSSWSSAKCSRTGMAKMSFPNPRFRSKHTEVPNCRAASCPAQGTAVVTWRLQDGNFSVVMPAHTQQDSLGGHLGPHKTDYKAHDAWNLVVQTFFSGFRLLTGLWHTWPFPASFSLSLLLPMLQIQASTPNLQSSKTTGWKIAFRLLRQTPVQLILANRLGGRTTNQHLKVNAVFFSPSWFLWDLNDPLIHVHKFRHPAITETFSLILHNSPTVSWPPSEQQESNEGEDLQHIHYLDCQDCFSHACMSCSKPASTWYKSVNIILKLI